VAYEAQATIIGCDIAIGDIGIACDIACYVSVRENSIRGFRWYGILVYRGVADISNNVVRDCANGIYFYQSTGSITENRIIHNKVGITLHSSKVTVKSNTFRRNRMDIRILW
jgi:parallel beta-helix repeat protein